MRRVDHGGVVVEHLEVVPEVLCAEVQVERDQLSVQDLTGTSPPSGKISAYESSDVLDLVLPCLLGCDVLAVGLMCSSCLAEPLHKVAPLHLAVLPGCLFAVAAYGDVEAAVVLYACWVHFRILLFVLSICSCRFLRCAVTL